MLNQLFCGQQTLRKCPYFLGVRELGSLCFCAATFSKVCVNEYARVDWVSLKKYQVWPIRKWEKRTSKNEILKKIYIFHFQKYIF